MVGNAKGNRPYGRPGRRWDENIRRNLQEVDVRDEMWVYINQARIQSRTRLTASMNLRIV